MQRIFICTLLLLLGLSAMAQNPYISFVEKSSVKWAAFATDTFRFSDLNLNLFLRNQLSNNKIEARLTDYDNQTEIKVSVDSVRERIAPSLVVRMVDEDGKVSEEAMIVEDQLYNNTYFNSFTNNLVNVQQVIYLENGKLQSHIPWVSPMYYVITSMGTELGMSNAFQTAFNKDPNIKKRWKRKAVYLGNTNKKMLLNQVSAGIPLLKPMYGNNLLKAIWPYLNNKPFELVEPLSNNILSQKDLSMYLLDSTAIEIPIYDEAGEISSYKKMDLRDVPLLLDSIPFVVLEQEWFYLPKQNKLFSNIKSIECWGKKTIAGKLEDQPSPFLKINQAK